MKEEGTRKNKDRKVNQHYERGAIQAQAQAPGKKTSGLQIDGKLR